MIGASENGLGLVVCTLDCRDLDQFTPLEGANPFAPRS